jgi:peptidoglycan hydrolase-like protein with peptidoglycan-binding domain
MGKIKGRLASAAAALALAGGAVVAGAGPAAAEPYCNYISDTSRPTVYPGDEGPAVAQVQCLINQYSAYPTWVTEDGDYGTATGRAIMWVQTCNGTTGGADGIVGSSTWYRLYTPKAACDLY